MPEQQPGEHSLAAPPSGPASADPAHPARADSDPTHPVRADSDPTHPVRADSEPDTGVIDPTLDLPPAERGAPLAGGMAAPYDPEPPYDPERPPPPVDPWAEVAPVWGLGWAGEPATLPPTLVEPPPVTTPPITAPPAAFPPAAFPPAAFPPAAFPPAAFPVVPPGYELRRKRRRWPRRLTYLLLTIGCCCGCPAYFLGPMWEQYPASAAFPAEVAGFDRLEDARSEKTAERLRQEMGARHWLAEDVFAAVYGDGGWRVTVSGTTGFRLAPKSDLESEFAQLTEEFALTDVRDVDPGAPGGHQRCGLGRARDDDIVLCAWADHGSLGVATFSGDSLNANAERLREFRTQIITREN